MRTPGNADDSALVSHSLERAASRLSGTGATVFSVPIASVVVIAPLSRSAGRRLAASTRGPRTSLGATAESPIAEAPESLRNPVVGLFRCRVLVVVENGNHQSGDQPGVV